VQNKILIACFLVPLNRFAHSRTWLLLSHYKVTWIMTIVINKGLMTQTKIRGGSRIHKRGAQIHCSGHDNCVRSTQSGMQSMPNLGGLGACPPRKFWKIKSSEIESEDTFNGLLLLLFQDSMHIAKQLMYIWLNSTESRGPRGMPPEKF